jgi:hypothetical protein
LSSAASSLGATAASTIRVAPSIPEAAALMVFLMVPIILT